MNTQVYGPLPVTRNMPYHTASVPSQSQPRNMTGIYLGLEGNQRPPKLKNGVPPLARSRGFSRMKTPTEEQRYRKVELLRIKEEKRGFSGNPVKRYQQHSAANSWGGSLTSAYNSPTSRPLSSAPNVSTPTPGYNSPGPALSEPSRRWGPGRSVDPSSLDDRLKTNPRQFTPVVNSGVTRSEKLTGWPEVFQPHHANEETVDHEYVRDVMTEEVDLVGLEECFRKVCKGNIEVLYSLLPGKRPKPQKDNTGFNVRSYRNPKQAEILADFARPAVDTLQRVRPKTVPIRRPLVPQPYFFRHYVNHPRAAAIAAQQQVRYLPTSVTPGTLTDTQNYFHATSKIVASPGAGTISRSLQQRIQSPAAAWTEQSRPRTEPPLAVIPGESGRSPSPLPEIEGK
ncbi:hypothetical protein BaRGS_00003230, partial [Batillaria attramentaria]